MRKRPLPKSKKPNMPMRQRSRLRKHYNDMFNLHRIITGLATDEHKN